MKIAKNLDLYLSSKVKNNRIVIPNVKNRKQKLLKNLSLNLISKISETPHKNYQRDVLGEKPNEVREILNITKVPFMGGTIETPLARRSSLVSKKTKFPIKVKNKRKKSQIQDSLILEEIEFDKIHGEILSQNISKGINRDSKIESQQPFLPNLKTNDERTSIVINKDKPLRKSTSVPSFSLKDFK